LHRTVSGSASVNPYSTTANRPYSGPAVATNVDCAKSWFNYSGSDLMRTALVSMKLTVNDRDSGDSESVTLQHAVHVSNTP
jgi:hypothetical protein